MVGAGLPVRIAHAEHGECGVLEEVFLTRSRTSSGRSASATLPARCGAMTSVPKVENDGAVRILSMADFGARIVKVERLGIGDETKPSELPRPLTSRW